MDKIGIVKRQIVNSIRNQKWSLTRELFRESGHDYTSYVYENLIDNNIKIVVRPYYKYSGSLTDKVVISIKTNGYWRSYNALSYGFSKAHLRFLRTVLYFMSISNKKLEIEKNRYRDIKELSGYSEKFINENKQIFRDYKIDEIIK